MAARGKQKNKLQVSKPASRAVRKSGRRAKSPRFAALDGATELKPTKHDFVRDHYLALTFAVRILSMDSDELRASMAKLLADDGGKQGWKSAHNLLENFQWISKEFKFFGEMIDVAEARMLLTLNAISSSEGKPLLPP